MQPPQQQVTINISEIYLPLWTTKRRYCILSGGRASLKTSTVMYFIAQLTFEQDQVILYTRYTMSSAKNSIVPLFSSELNRFGLLDSFDIVSDKVTNRHTGSYILFSGIKTNQGNQTGKLKSLPNVTTWVIEEGEDFNDEEAFETIDDSIRGSAVQNRIIWIQNPTTREHFIYRKFIEGHSKKVNIHGYDVTVSDHPQVEAIHTTYHLAKDFGYLDADWLTKIKRVEEQATKQIASGTDKHETRYYYKYIGGWLERSEGAIFKNWEEGKYIQTLYHGYGLDYGFSPDPLALIEISVDKKRKLVYMREKLYNTNLSDSDVIQALNNVIDNKRDLILCDHNEPRTTLAIRKGGFNIVPAKKGKGSIADGIRSLQDYTFIVDPDSENLKKELNNYSWNNKRASIPVDDYNHLMDALRYVFRKLTIAKSVRVSRPY